jgi:hypothetical protein
MSLLRTPMRRLGDQPLVFRRPILRSAQGVLPRLPNEPQLKAGIDILKIYWAPAPALQ